MPEITSQRNGCYEAKMYTELSCDHKIPGQQVKNI